MCQCANDLFRKAKKFKVDGRKRSGLTRFWDVAIGYPLKIDFRFVCSAAAEQTNLQIDLLLFFCSKKVSKKGALQLEEILHPSLIQSGKFQNSAQMNLPLRQLKFPSLFHNAGPEVFLLGPGVHE